MPTQYGFRKDKSTADAIHIVRRLAHRGFTIQENMHMALLDWEKAFGKIIHSKLIAALRRLNIPAKIINVIKAMYKNPQFFVKAEGQTSTKCSQQSGIRQGCPLSPYLFILAMTVMFYDVHKDDKAHTVRQRFEGMGNDEILYADDTICVTKTIPAMNRLVAEIEKQGACAGLKLNHERCEYMCFGNAGEVTYTDGTRIPYKNEVKYLGVLINDQADINKVITAKISECSTILTSSNSF